MADAARALLLKQVVEDAVGGVEVAVHVHLAHVVEEVEVEVAGAGLLELPLEDLLDLAHVGEVVAGELVGEVEGVARVACERAAEHDLRLARVVAPGGVEVVHALLERIVDHLVNGSLVGPGVVAVHARQAHRTEAQPRKALPLEVTVQHASSPLHK